MVPKEVNAAVAMISTQLTQLLLINRERLSVADLTMPVFVPASVETTWCQCAARDRADRMPPPDGVVAPGLDSRRLDPAAA